MTRQDILKDRVSQAFIDAFGHAPDLLVSAPGRVNLIGEHTDYNDGFVLPCAIDYQTIVAISPDNSGVVQAIANDLEEVDRFDVSQPFTSQAAEWKNHVRGVVASFDARGFSLTGAKIAVGGNIPQGAGLSSSASLGVALGKSLATANNLDDIDNTDIARIAQQAENDFVGCACGIMDQLASARSHAGHAMLLDCRSLETKPIAIPPEASVLVVHSGIKRGLVDSAYNDRRSQCENAAKHYGVNALRDIDEMRLIADRGDLDETIYRRARHVVTENHRTVEMANALLQKDMQSIARLMAESHESMRDDFNITLPAIDQLVTLVAKTIGDSGGVRMTGGGFGGCIASILPKNLVERVASVIRENYQMPDGAEVQIFECIPSNGVSVL